MRAHYTRPVTDEQGNLLPNVQVTLFQPATTTLISDVIYSDDTSFNVLSNPWISSTGIIDFYLDNPERVRIGTVVGDAAIQYAEDVDVLAAGSDSQHVGGGSNSLQIGIAAVATGDESTALGPSATTLGQQSTAVGDAANAVGNQSIAIGAATTALASEIAIGNAATTAGGFSVAMGDTSAASAASATALGQNATSAWVHSTALGADSQATGANQIMLGSPSDTVVIPVGSKILLTSPGGFPFVLTVGDDGALDTEPA
jgi:hypothetical protein